MKGQGSKGLALPVHVYSMDNHLTSSPTEPVLPCKARGFGSPMGRHSGRTKLSKPSGAEPLLCSQVMHRQQEAKQGEEVISSIYA